MKNRKGFTMVELLGAVVILGILMMVAIPSVSSLIKGSKNKYYISQKKNLESAAKSYYGNNKIILREEGDFVDVSLEELVKKKYISKMVDGTKADCVMTKPAGNEKSQEYTFVRIKREKNRVTYTSHLYCPAYQDEDIGVDGAKIKFSVSNDGKSVIINLEHQDEERIITSYTYQLYLGENNLVKRTLNNNSSTVQTSYDVSRFITASENEIRVYIYAVDDKGDTFSDWGKTKVIDDKTPSCYVENVEVLNDYGDKFKVSYSFICSSENGCESTNNKGTYVFTDNPEEPTSQTDPDRSFDIPIKDRLTGNESNCKITFRAIHKYKLTYDDNGGSGCSDKSITKEKGLTWGRLCKPTPGNSNMEFFRWRDKSNTNVVVTENTMVNKHTTVQAQYIHSKLGFDDQTLKNGMCSEKYISNAFKPAYDGLDSYTYKIESGQPAGATLDSNTRIITFPSSTKPGTYNIKVKAIDETTKKEAIATMTINIETEVSINLVNAKTNGKINGTKTVSANSNVQFPLVPDEGVKPFDDSHPKISCNNGQKATFNKSNNTLTVNNVTACNTVCNVKFELKTYLIELKKGSNDNAIDLPKSFLKTYGQTIELGYANYNKNNKHYSYLGWATKSKAKSDDKEVTWYDRGAKYSKNEPLTVYAQWYDIYSLEEKYSTFVQAEDFEQINIKKASENYTAGNVYTWLPTKPSSSGKSVKSISGYNFPHVVRPYTIADNTKYRAMVDYSNATPTINYLMVNNRASKTHHDYSVDERITALQKLQDVKIAYEDIKLVRGDTIDLDEYKGSEGLVRLNSTNYRSATLTFTPDTNYKFIGAMGFAVGSDNKEGSFSDKIFVNRLETALDGSSATITVSDSIVAEAEARIYGNFIEVKNNKKERTTNFKPTSDKGRNRLLALEALNNAKEKYFSASDIKIQEIAFPMQTIRSSSDWSSVELQKNISIPKGKILGMPLFDISGGTGGNCALIKGAYVDIVSDSTNNYGYGPTETFARFVIVGANSQRTSTAATDIIGIVPTVGILYISPSNLTFE